MTGNQHGSSPWLLAFHDELHTLDTPLWTADTIQEYRFAVYAGWSGVWALVETPKEGRLGCLLCYDPSGSYAIREVAADATHYSCQLQTVLGSVDIQLEWLEATYPLLHWRTTLTPSTAVDIPFWPRDLYPLARSKEAPLEGVVHTKQFGLNAGLVYATMGQPEGGSWLYMQNLSSLGAYNDRTKTQPASVVGGTWPELGFALPPTEGHALPAETAVIISDAYLAFSSEQVSNEGTIARLFLDLYADIFGALPKPQTSYHDWPERAKRTLQALGHEPACITTRRNHRYFNAYVQTADRPPESLVQLAVLCPLNAYAKRMGVAIPLLDSVRAGLPTFFDPHIGSVVRWLPGEAQGHVSDENMHVRNMDSWYLYVIMRNLGRLAKAGYRDAEKLFLDSLPYTIRVARHFDYHWPISFDVDTLEIVQQGSGSGPGIEGELDVAGVYASILIQAYDMTGERQYLEEAMRGARTLHGRGFALPYQYNVTMIAATALLRLWQEIGDQQWLDLSHMCLAAFVQALWLWECRYGHVGQYPAFMALPPQPGATYCAVFEEACVHDTLSDYLEHAGSSLPTSGTLLMTEYIRHLLYRGWWAFPDMLPDEMLASTPRSGAIDKQLSVPLEDIGDGWYKAGTVGQQVYGGGVPFTLVARHYQPLPDVGATLFCDYPLSEIAVKQDMYETRLRFHINGDERGTCRLRMMPLGDIPLPSVTLTCDTAPSEGTLTTEGAWETSVPGGSTVTLVLSISEEGLHNISSDIESYAA